MSNRFVKCCCRIFNRLFTPPLAIRTFQLSGIGSHSDQRRAARCHGRPATEHDRRVEEAKPRVAAGLTSQATPGQRALHHAPHSPAPSMRLHLHFSASFAIRSSRSNSGSAAIAISNASSLHLAHSPPQPPHCHPRVPPRPQLLTNRAW